MLLEVCTSTSRVLGRFATATYKHGKAPFRPLGTFYMCDNFSWQPCHHRHDHARRTNPCHHQNAREANVTAAGLRRTLLLLPGAQPPRLHRRLQTHNNRTFTRDNLEEYLPGIEAHGEDVCQAIIDAHTSLQVEFVEPPTSHPDLRWPCAYDTATKTFSAHEKCDKLQHSIQFTPGKGRHNGFHLNFLARLDKQWCDLCVRLECIMLTARYQPRLSRDSTRALIPKPNSYRIDIIRQREVKKVESAEPTANSYS